MLGANGGLIGAVRKPSGRSASGLWFQNEQSLAKRAGNWVIPVGVYSQSSVYPGTAAASAENMTNGSFSDTGTATNNDVNAFVMIDYGEPVFIQVVTIGTATSAIPGGWSKTYTENKAIQTSSDNSSWTTLFNTGTFASDGIYKFYGPGNFTPVSARYIRIFGTFYVGISEFCVN